MHVGEPRGKLFCNIPPGDYQFQYYPTGIKLYIAINISPALQCYNQSRHQLLRQLLISGVYSI